MGNRYYESSLFIESNWVQKINMDKKSEGERDGEVGYKRQKEHRR